jgi:Cytochrome c7 and related cytochrome c/Cytochrome c554 and c-prime
MDMTRVRVIALGACAGLLLTHAAFSQDSRCADCHYANPTAPGQRHLQDWDRSPHGRSHVGCERCHGGNPREFEPTLAHRDIIRVGARESPVSRERLPATCGACHTGPLLAFRASRHYELLQSGNHQGPTCSTCHGDVVGSLLSPKALASQCNECHGPGEVAPRAERARLVRDQYEGLRVVREQMKLAQSLIKRIDDRKRREELTRTLEQAQVPLTLAQDAGHRFVYDDLRQYLSVAQERVEALLQRLANR